MTSSATVVPVPTAELRAASAAVYTAFIGAGFAAASWASRIPQVRDRLDLDPSQLGLVLLALAGGSVLSMPLSGPVVARMGTRSTVRAMALLLGLALGVVAVGYLTGITVLVVGLLVLGFAVGAWNVAMNVQGAVVEQRLGRSIMPRYHAGYSLGTVLGALVGVAMIAVRVPVTAHLVLASAAVATVVIVQVRHFVADDETTQGAIEDAGPPPARPAAAAGIDALGVGDPPAARSSLAAWREPRTLLIGVVALAFAFAEGTGNDWISIALIDDYGLPAALGALAFAVFLAAMTVVRWFGPTLLDRYGRVPVVRALALVGVVGLLLFVFSPDPLLAYAGALLWGAGIALGFPVSMSAGADEPRAAAGRVSVIATLGYCAFLGGPPLIGFLGDSYTVLRALTAVAVLLGLAVLLAEVVRAPKAVEPTSR